MSLNVEILEQSFEKIKPRAEEFAASFYENLFTAYPEVKPLFAVTEMKKQQKKLLSSLVLVVENLRNPEALGPVLNALGGRHVGYGVLPKYYPVVREALLLTFEQYLQQDWTPEVKQAWLEALTTISELMLKGAGEDNRQETVQPTEKIPEKPAEFANFPLETAVDAEPIELPVDLLKTSFEKIKPRAEEFAASFYENLFTAYPEVKPLFAVTEMIKQQKKLLNSLVLVVENLRNPEALGPVLKALGARHIAYGATAKNYRPVGEALLMTFEQYLQEDWTPEVKQAWVDAYRAITALMLKGASEQSLPKVVREEKAATSEKSSELKAEVKNKSKPSQPLLFVQNWAATLKKVPQKIVDTFWRMPAWSVAGIVTVIIIGIVLNIDENSVFAEILNSLDTISLVIALVLFVKEAPDRRKQFHYQAWGIIDSSNGVKVSYARILALQDLNEDGVVLRGLDAPGAELVEINLPKANLSQANLSETDLTNANLSYANLNYTNLRQSKLSAANLSHANASFACLSQANLSSANLSNANLICADLSQANLSGVNLKGASLSGANLEGAYLTGANLKNAQVSIAELSSAFLEGAIMPNGSKYQAPKV